MKIVAWLMTVFGLAEIVKAVTRNFFGVHTAQSHASTSVGSAIGVLCAAAGLLVITAGQRAAALACGLLVVVVHTAVA